MDLKERIWWPVVFKRKATARASASRPLHLIEEHIRRRPYTNPLSTMVDLSDVFKDSHLRFPFTDVIRIDGKFRPEIFVDGLVKNLIHFNALLSVHTWLRIVDFCRRRFCGKSDRVGLQILFTLTKTDPREFDNARRQNYCDEITSCALSVHCDEFYARTLDRPTAKRIKKFLKQPVVVRAFRQCLEKVFHHEIDSGWIDKTVSSMKICYGYDASYIRGACLRDGIFVNFSELYPGNCVSEICSCGKGIERWLLRLSLGEEQSKRHYADLVTLSIHETAHFLARVFTGNCNMSTPISAVADGDVGEEAEGSIKNTELGRLVAHTLFDMQPSWRSCSDIAASLFLERAQQPITTLPLISVADLANLERMTPRKGVCVSAGVDLCDPEVFWLCY